MNFKNKLIIMNKKDLKKFLIENESHTIENTEEKLLSFVKGTMLNRNDVIDQDDQSHHRQEERLRNQLDKQVHEHHHHLEEIEALTGVFEEVEGEGDADATPRISSPGVIFHAATGIDAATVAPVQTTLQKRILRAFVARGLLENCDAKDMLGYKHSGFSVDAGVCIEAHDRAALERLLRYCAIARVHRFPWSAYAKREANWCTAVPNSAASPPVTSVVPRQMSCTSHRWN